MTEQKTRSRISDKTISADLTGVFRRSIRTLIVDDEPLARQFLRRMLAEHPDIEIVGECSNGVEALAAVKLEKPDLLFLDIQMPEMSGIALVEALSGEKIPAVIFATAYDQFAIQAFELHAIDYLLKPFDRRRFEKSLGRAREQIGNQNERLDRGQLGALVERLANRDRCLDRMVVKSGGRIVFVKTSDIDWIKSDDKYVHIHVGKSSYMIRQTISTLESQLDPNKFVRIHRSTIVNIDRIKELQPMFHGEFAVLLTTGAQLTLSRNYRRRFEDMVGKPT